MTSNKPLSSAKVHLKQQLGGAERAEQFLAEIKSGHRLIAEVDYSPTFSQGRLGWIGYNLGVRSVGVLKKPEPISIIKRDEDEKQSKVLAVDIKRGVYKEKLAEAQLASLTMFGANRFDEPKIKPVSYILSHPSQIGKRQGELIGPVLIGSEGNFDHLSTLMHSGDELIPGGEFNTNVLHRHTYTEPAIHAAMDKSQGSPDPYIQAAREMMSKCLSLISA